jgi:hypothetical protein
MKPEELSKLTPLQLLRYNSPLPQIDPENPYVHTEYPKYLYQVTADYRLISALVRDDKEESQLDGDWRDSILDWGIVTHPESARFETGLALNIQLTPQQRDQLELAKAARKAAATAKPPKPDADAAREVLLARAEHASAK